MISFRKKWYEKVFILWFLVMPLGLYSQIKDLFYVFGGGTIGYSESPSFSEFAQFYNDARKDELEKGVTLVFDTFKR